MAVAASAAVDDDDVGGQSRQAGEALPIGVGLEAHLVGEGRTPLNVATHVSGELRRGIEQEVDATTL